MQLPHGEFSHILPVPGLVATIFHPNTLEGLLRSYQYISMLLYLCQLLIFLKPFKDPWVVWGEELLFLLEVVVVVVIVVVIQ